ncbi:hypothetical protein SISNIDRAFT_383282, partial [Sistotremastrum niveocremeum HHB9708]
ELRALYYACAIHDQGYVVILKALREVGMDEVVDVPILRFAATGVAIPQELTQSLEEPVWIVEEKIPGQFTKYINNNGLTPMPGLVGRNLAIAVFLCFCQHVHYLISTRRCIVADYQGMCF